jgi:hypothetical protein
LLPDLFLIGAVPFALVGLLVAVHVIVDQAIFGADCGVVRRAGDCLQVTGLGHERHAVESIFEERAVGALERLVKRPDGVGQLVL